MLPPGGRNWQLISPHLNTAQLFCPCSIVVCFTYYLKIKSSNPLTGTGKREREREWKENKIFFSPKFEFELGFEFSLYCASISVSVHKQWNRIRREKKLF